jgi:hypothetical protein
VKGDTGMGGEGDVERCALATDAVRRARSCGVRWRRQDLDISPWNHGYRGGTGVCRVLPLTAFLAWDGQRDAFISRGLAL